MWLELIDWNTQSFYRQCGIQLKFMGNFAAKLTRVQAERMLVRNQRYRRRPRFLIAEAN